MIRTQIDVTAEEMEEVALRLGLDQCVNAQFSWLFLGQLAAHWRLRSQVNVWSLRDEVFALEGVQGQTRTKRETQFTAGKLRGFWHKHFFSGAVLPCNCLRECAKGDVASGQANFSQLENVIERHMRGGHTEENVKRLSHTVVMRAFKGRSASRALTGSWIVFAKHGSQNHYLAISPHGGDTNFMYDEIKKHCNEQFPFLFPPQSGVTSHRVV